MFRGPPQVFVDSWRHLTRCRRYTQGRRQLVHHLPGMYPLLVYRRMSVRCADQSTENRALSGRHFFSKFNQGPLGSLRTPSFPPAGPVLRVQASLRTAGRRARTRGPTAIDSSAGHDQRRSYRPLGAGLVVGSFGKSGRPTDGFHSTSIFAFAGSFFHPNRSSNSCWLKVNRSPESSSAT